MSNPLLWLGAYLAFDHLNSQAQETKARNDHITRLEQTAIASDDNRGCLGTAFLLFIVIPIGLALLCGLFFTTTGQVVLGIAAILFLLVLAVKKSPWAIVLGTLYGSVPIYSEHGMMAVLFFWSVVAVIIFVAWKIFRRLY
jgi:hypothetical protein